ncbi:SdpI family protein [Corynebacterium sp. sy039]|uniref:SdpI family protein n=1 Tax=Corynebacterium sp. sy039 TaxID=2599641 RepID=UPI0011B57551|nr:SdpI family protein [Corynebacterium sp. sy039]QDZ43425.1 SdpI family protein [Corynebacterium sp. sy039]
MNTGIIIGTALSLCSLFLLTIGVLSWCNALRGNKIIGIRVPEVRKSEELWNAAHHVAGPIWVLASISLSFGGLMSFNAHGWEWLLPIAFCLITLVLISLGANLGARTAAILDQQQQQSTDQGCDCGGTCSTETNAEPAATPEVDVTALRRAAHTADAADSAHAGAEPAAKPVTEG